MSEMVWYHHAMPSLSLPSANLHYRIDGSGPTLLLLHGAGGNSLVWFQQIPELSKRFSCIAIDQPGFGRSAWRHEPVRYSAVLCELIEYLELERIGILGHSLGGWAALQLALRLPERISALILSSSWAGLQIPDVLACLDERETPLAEARQAWPGTESILRS